MQKTCISLLALSMGLICRCQDLSGSAAAKYFSLSAYGAKSVDGWSSLANVAALGKVETSLASAVIERRWALKELESHWIEGVYCLKKSAVSCGLLQRGDENYQHVVLHAGYGRDLGLMQLGLQVGYAIDRSPGYPADRSAVAGIAMRFPMKRQWIAGWQLQIPVKFEGGKKISPSRSYVFGLGIGYQWNEAVLLAAAVRHVSGEPTNLIIWLDYRYSGHFSFAFGVDAGSGEPCFRSSWEKRGLTVAIYVLYDGTFGATPGLETQWRAQTDHG